MGAWEGQLKIVTAIFILAVAAPAEAQNLIRVNARLQTADFTLSGRRPSGMRMGVGLALEHAADDGAGRLAFAYAPASASDHGWQSITFEAVPYVITIPVTLGIRFFAGGQHITAARGGPRRPECELDPILCFSDGASGMSSSWAALIGAAGEVRVPLGARILMSASLGMGYLVGGLNEGARGTLSSLGIGYTM
jgi:hypothetical protein